MRTLARNYSLTGPEGEKAREKGLVKADWYKCEVPRQQLKELMKKRNGPVMRDTMIWVAILILWGYVSYLSWGTWWAIPAFLVYGAIYNVPAVSKWHELSHGTPFKTEWLNEALYQVTSFMILVQATTFRWSHVRHHTDTIIVGRDTEIPAHRPPNWNAILLNFFRLTGFKIVVMELIRHSMGRVSDEERAFIPESAWKKLFWEARIWIGILLAIVGLCIYTGSILPLMFVGLPSFYGQPLNSILVITQHGGLSEDVVDHRLNTRTFYTNPVLQFLYSNMNFHLEHHMFSRVPYYNLPKLHKLIKHDCPPAYPSLYAAFKEGIVAIYRQRKEPSYTPERPLPDSAIPFRFHPRSEDV